MVDTRTAKPAKETTAHSLRWLHISDIHFWGKKEWSDGAARSALLKLLRESFANSSLPKPDLIFCTGDIAQGETKSDEMPQQYDSAKTFFSDLLNVCGLDSTKLFVVPGNHDVNRTNVSPMLQDGLRSQNLDRIQNCWEEKDPSFQQIIMRLNEYSAFIKQFLPHQIDSEDRHCYQNVIEIKGIRLGVAGFNSAWTCFDDKDKDQLWLAAHWQFNRAASSFADQTDLCVGLIHHPISWLKDEEQKLASTRVREEFDFWLHGHEHQTWINKTGRNTCISAGAVNAGSDEEFGINLVDLNLLEGTGKAHLFAYIARKNKWEPISEGQCQDLQFNKPKLRQVTAPVLKPSSPAPTDASILSKLEKTIDAAFAAEGTAQLKQNIQDEIGMLGDVSVAQLLQALDALPSLQERMVILQIALANSSIPTGEGSDAHPTEKAVMALYMRAAILAVNLDASQALRSATKGLTLMPEKKDVLIAVLMAALDNEWRELCLHENLEGSDKKPSKQAKDTALIDLDELPMLPLKTEQAIELEAAARVDKACINTSDSRENICKQVKLSAEIQRRVRRAKYFRFVVSQDQAGVLQDDQICGELSERLGIPMTKIMTGGDVKVEELLGISASEIDLLFTKFLDFLKQAKQPK